MKCSSKYTLELSCGHLAADCLGDDYSMPVPHSLVPALPLHQRELWPKPVELSLTLLDPPPSPEPHVPAPLSASTAAALWGRSMWGAAGLLCCRIMRKERSGRYRPLPMPPYGEGVRGAPPASAAAALWGRSNAGNIFVENSSSGP
jgi:hypothetical protein